VRCGYAWCRIVAASLRACVPACTCVSSVPVPDADALDMDIHACVRALGGGVPVCARVIRGYPYGVLRPAPA
jgi:hypothetical protein